MHSRVECSPFFHALIVNAPWPFHKQPLKSWEMCSLRSKTPRRSRTGELHCATISNVSNRYSRHPDNPGHLMTARELWRVHGIRHKERSRDPEVVGRIKSAFCIPQKPQNPYRSQVGFASRDSALSMTQSGASSLPPVSLPRHKYVKQTHLLLERAPSRVSRAVQPQSMPYCHHDI